MTQARSRTEAHILTKMTTSFNVRSWSEGKKGLIFYDTGYLWLPRYIYTCTSHLLHSLGMLRQESSQRGTSFISLLRCIAAAILYTSGNLPSKLLGTLLDSVSFTTIVAEEEYLMLQAQTDLTSGKSQ